MSVLVDTSTVPVADRFDYWAHAHGQVLHPLRLRRPGSGPFEGRIRAYQFGPVTLFRIEGNASAIRRTSELIARHDPEEFQVTHLVRGQFRVEQGDRTAFIGAGDLSAYETSHPYDVQARSDFELLLYSVPRALFGDRAEALCGRTATAVPRVDAAAALAGPFLRGLADRVLTGELDPGSPGLPDCVVDMVRLVFDGNRAASDGPAEPSGEALFLRVVDYIDAHLGEPDLGPRTLASAHFVSPRLLHKVFEARGHTVAGWIRSRRLAAVSRDLVDPALAGRPIRLLAAARGFPDPPHFTRLFRANYGRTPGEYRRDR